MALKKKSQRHLLIRGSRSVPSLPARLNGLWLFSHCTRAPGDPPKNVCSLQTLFILICISTQNSLFKIVFLCIFLAFFIITRLQNIIKFITYFCNIICNFSIHTKRFWIINVSKKIFVRK